MGGKSDPPSLLLALGCWCLPGVWMLVRHLTDPDCPVKREEPSTQVPRLSLVAQGQRLWLRKVLALVEVSPKEATFSLGFSFSPSFVN